MKTTTLHSVYFLVISILFTWLAIGCNKEAKKGERTEETKIVSLEKLVESYNKDKINAHQMASLYEGEMTIITLPSTESLFMLEGGEEEGGILFYCQSEPKSSDANEVMDKNLGLVRAAYLREALVVSTSDGELFTFSIGKGQGDELIKDIKANWQHIGFGLSAIQGRGYSPEDFRGLQSVADTRADVACLCVRHTETAECEAGGSGSTSCSISSGTASCNVTCDGWHYACCNTE
jgi:hypothetical protein